MSTFFAAGGALRLEGSVKGIHLPGTIRVIIHRAVGSARRVTRFANWTKQTGALCKAMDASHVYFLSPGLSLHPSGL